MFDPFKNELYGRNDLFPSSHSPRNHKFNEFDKMERWVGKTAIVTGSSSGIGAAISEKFVKLGINVVGLARRMNLLEKLSEKISQNTNLNAKFYPLQCDMSKEENILQAFSWIEDNVGPISIMVNNAGVYMPTTIINGDSNSWRITTDLNVLAACICTKLAIKSMKSHNIDDGQIINIGSISGYYVPYVDPPVLNIYSSSKFCLRSVTETLRRELRYYKSKIRTTYIAPGLVATDLLAVDDSSDTDGMVSDEIPMLKSEDVADVCAFVLSTQPHCQLPEIVMRVVGEEI